MNHSITQYLQQDSKTLGKLLSRLNQLQQWNAGLKECLAEHQVLSEHCFIVNLAGTSLIVLADNSHWMTRFRFHVPALLLKLRNYSGLENIQSICCKVEPHYVPASSLKNSGPQQKLSVTNANLMHEIAEKITDEKLKIVLEKIARHLEK
jgi:hypothetical protein